MILFKIVKVVIVMVFLILIFMGYITKQFIYKFNKVVDKIANYINYLKNNCSYVV